MSVAGPDDEDQAAAVEVLMAASRVMSAVVARTLAGLEETVSIPQFRVLVMLRYEGALNLKSIADGMGVNPSNASRTCEKLVAAGLLKRDDAEHDRRNVSISLTPRGRRTVDSLMRARAEMLAQAVADMRPVDRRRLVPVLTAFLDAVDSSGLSEMLLAHNAAIPAWLRRDR
jgi:DNA-binding MarR family transcriptional regulator